MKEDCKDNAASSGDTHERGISRMNVGIWYTKFTGFSIRVKAN